MTARFTAAELGPCGRSSLTNIDLLGSSITHREGASSRASLRASIAAGRWDSRGVMRWDSDRRPHSSLCADPGWGGGGIAFTPFIHSARTRSVRVRVCVTIHSVFIYSFAPSHIAFLRLKTSRVGKGLPRARRRCFRQRWTSTGARWQASFRPPSPSTPPSAASAGRGSCPGTPSTARARRGAGARPTPRTR